MMVARQDLLLDDFVEHLAHDAAQRLLGQEIVAEVVGHARSGLRLGLGGRMLSHESEKRARKWRLLLPGASGPRLTELNPPGLQFGLSNRLRGLSNRSIVVVCNYETAR